MKYHSGTGGKWRQGVIYFGRSVNSISTVSGRFCPTYYYSHQIFRLSAIPDNNYESSAGKIFSRLKYKDQNQSLTLTLISFMRESQRSQILLRNVITLGSSARFFSTSSILWGDWALVFSVLAWPSFFYTKD